MVKQCIGTKLRKFPFFNFGLHLTKLSWSSNSQGQIFKITDVNKEVPVFCVK